MQYSGPNQQQAIRDERTEARRIVNRTFYRFVYSFVTVIAVVLLSIVVLSMVGGV